MGQELILKAIKMLDDPNKWDAFIDLTNQKEKIKNEMFRHLRNVIEKYIKEITYSGWKIAFHTQYWHIRWYLDREDIKDRINIGFYDKRMLFWVDSGIYDSDAVNKLLNSPEFLPIRLSMRNDVFLENPNDKIIEIGNWIFNSAYDGTFQNEDQMAWYAYYESDRFMIQIKEKVEKFCMNDLIPGLIVKIHEETKKQ